jgi:hypothetical protein
MKLESLLASLENTQRYKPYPLKFNDEMYYFWNAETTKPLAENYATAARQLGYKARIVNKEKHHEIYIRRK